MTSIEFRAEIRALGYTQESFAHRLRELGDTRPHLTILRSLVALAAVDRTAPIPWAVVCLIGAEKKLLVMRNTENSAPDCARLQLSA